MMGKRKGKEYGNCEGKGEREERMKKRKKEEEKKEKKTEAGILAQQFLTYIALLNWPPCPVTDTLIASPHQLDKQAVFTQLKTSEFHRMSLSDHTHTHTHTLSLIHISEPTRPP